MLAINAPIIKNVGSWWDPRLQYGQNSNDEWENTKGTLSAMPSSESLVCT